MVILEDTRQQAGKHSIKHEWFRRNGIHIQRYALICGDYQIPGDGSVAIDSKKDILELIGDIQVSGIAKKDVKAALCDYFGASESDGRVEALYSLICDDDSDRFPEQQISDYCFENNISEDIQDKCQDLYVKRHGFFHRGLIRAKQHGVRLYVLVENRDGVKDINTLFRWVNPRSRIFVNSGQQIGWCKNGKPRYKKVQKYPHCMQGATLAKACLTMQLKYGVTFVFCRPEEAGERIVKLLGGG